MESYLSFGNHHQLGLLPHQSLHKLSKKHGPLMLLKLSQVPTLVVSSSQMTKDILKTHDLNFTNRPILRAAEILLYGSSSMGFSPYGEPFGGIEEEPLNMSQVLYFFTNDMLCKAILGKFSREEDRNKLFHKMIEENVRLLSGFNLVDYFPSLGWLNSLLDLDKRAKRNFNKWDVVLNQIFQEHGMIDEKVKDDGFMDILLSI
ncbi:cytochrome P450 71A9-like [Dioscorea cayenensis subsp. rotundata]|uniref:Cytochrome P450 71A9-like n=1 Tax=Dioscorea cayennensis subsp. rotundata TaxID=55577 RepID=A0AB40AL81_DIOCR|nr:cytochrome P450 71A9-like [Dioscorea cayenensis subsp. rotundata]